MQLLKLLRMLAATASGVAVGAVRMATGQSPGDAVELKVGDRAPDFALVGSDGVTHRLSDLLNHGHAVVIAWFPKAFTGG